MSSNYATILAIINGAWGILSGCLIVFLLVYLLAPVKRLRFEPPTGEEVALAVLAIAAGSFITRAVVWAWRVFYGAGPFSTMQTALLAIGAAIGAVGFLCAIRVFSRPFYGDAPWLSALGMVMIFTALSLALM